jgi:hypothetical protein
LTPRHSRSTKTSSPQSALAVHAGKDQHASKCHGGELAALMRVEDLRLAVANKSVLKNLNADRHLHPD